MSFGAPRFVFSGLFCALFVSAWALWSGLTGGPATAAPRFDGRVIVDATEYPWSALGRVNTGGRSYCTGTLISERSVLVEARCLFYATEGRWWDPSELHFVAGYQRDRFRVHSPVVHYHLAPGYDTGSAQVLSNVINNWAILTLALPIGRQAGWIRLQRLDEDALAQLERGEAFVLEAGYRRGQPHVITVSLDCGLRNLARQEFWRRGICRTLNLQPGLSRLFYFDDEFRVLAPQTMRPRMARRASASVPAHVDRFMPRQTLDGVLDGLGYGDVPAAPTEPAEISVTTLASVFDASLRESGLRDDGDLEIAAAAATPPAETPAVEARPAPALATVPAPLPARDAVPARNTAPAPVPAPDAAPILASGLVFIAAPMAASSREASAVPAPGPAAASTLATYRVPAAYPTAAATRADPPVTAAAPAAGTYVVQLASFSSRPVAVHASSMLRERFSDVLGGLAVFVQPAVLAGQGQVFQVRTGPYETLLLAHDTCKQIRTRNYHCLIVLQRGAGAV